MKELKSVPVLITLIIFVILISILLLRNRAATDVVPSSPRIYEPGVLSSEDMKKDLDFIVTTLVNVHPGAYRGISEDQNRIIKNAYERISSPITLEKYFFIANEIVCSFKDAHTSLRFDSTQPLRRLDIDVVWLQDGLYSTTDTGTGSIKRGDKIISIGGQDMSTLLQELSKITPSENTQWVKCVGRDNLISEPYLNHLGLTSNSMVTVKYQRDNKEYTDILQLKDLGQKNKSDDTDWVSYSIEKKNSLGIFTLNSCNYDNKYKSTLNKFFKEISKQHIDNIVIDIRKNTGGNSMVVDEFLRYIDVDEYVSYTGDIRLSKESISQRGYKEPIGYVSYGENIITNKKIENKSLLFKGRVFILTSSETFSSANWFGVIFKDNKLGTIVGEPTGNQPSSYGDILTFTTPASGLKLSVSHKKWVRPDNTKNSEDALYPDLTIYTTIEDILKGRDPQMEEVVKIIKSGGNN